MLLLFMGGSSIINISSIAGKRGSSNNSAYVASKFGMNGLTQSQQRVSPHVYVQWDLSSSYQHWSN